MLRSTVLVIAMFDVAIVATSLLFLGLRILPEPLDLIPMGLVMIVCPVAGLWFAVSGVKRDLAQGASRWQITLGVVLALAVFFYGFALMVWRD